MIRTKALLVVAAMALSPLRAAPPPLSAQLNQTVKPFIGKYCAGCHSGQSPAAQLDLKSFDTLDSVVKDFPHWALIKERLEAGTMPPAPMAPPPADQVRQVNAWIQAVRAEEIKRSAGDPGLVPARRLSNAEYDYTLRDLTGQDLRLTREFPLDPANPAGFDNSGESLTMSPGLLNKYLQAARTVASHVAFLPAGLAFAPHPMLVETDREKYAVQRILDFYRRQPVRYADYFQAAWRYRYRAALGLRQTTLAALAQDARLSPRYLQTVWTLLNEPAAVGPVRQLQQLFAQLPPPAAQQPQALTAQCAAMQEFVIRIRAHTARQFAAPIVAGLPAGSQPLLHWKNREFAAHRRESDPQALRNDTDPPPLLPAIPRYPGLHREAAPRWAALMAHARAGNPDLVVPAVQRARYEAAFARFASVFPDHFFVTERGRFFPDDSQDQGRHLSAGYHSVLGFFRDDTPLVELILDDAARRELDRLWLEFDFVASHTARTWIQYFLNQSGEVYGRGAESGSLRPSGREITDSSVITTLRDAYLAKAAASPANDPVAPRAIREHFDAIDATLRDLERRRIAAEPHHLQAVLHFAHRAYRRPLTAAESEDLRAYYRQLRTQNQVSHEDAIRELLVSVLMAPDFLYRLDLQSSRQPTTPPLIRAASTAGSAVPVQPLSGYALASRLSYFLWASTPDDELLARAAAGELHQRPVLLQQVRRMLQDPRVSGLATEFTGNWLGVRHFDRNNSVDRERFPAFNDALREAMFQEPVRFMTDIAVNNRSVLDLLYGRHTFVNPVLAQHYGLPAVPGDANTWVRVDDAARYGRGGLLPMAVFLTQNSPGLRTSPVKRGSWLVQRVLGEVIPPPPPSVPELPHDEAQAERPIRELLAKHRAHPQCAACHARFDSFGLAFEGYSPVGSVRQTDLAGRPVDTAATYPGGFSGTGLAGLQSFIRERRQQDFVANLSRKLLAFALNRSLQLSDEPLVEQMQARAPAHAYQFRSLVETIVTSPQFLNRRAPVTPAPSPVRRAKL